MAQEVTGDLGAKADLKDWYMNKRQKKKVAKLSYEERKDMPKKEFALPKEKDKENPAGKGAYPIEDEAHARDALARVSANGTPEEKAEVRAKVEKKYPGIEQSKGEEADKKDPKKKRSLDEWLKEQRRERVKKEKK